MKVVKKISTLATMHTFSFLKDDAYFFQRYFARLMTTVKEDLSKGY